MQFGPWRGGKFPDGWFLYMPVVAENHPVREGVEPLLGKPDTFSNIARSLASLAKKAQGAGIIPFRQALSAVVPDQPVVVIERGGQTKEALQQDMDRCRMQTGLRPGSHG